LVDGDGRGFRLQACWIYVLLVDHLVVPYLSARIGCAVAARLLNRYARLRSVRADCSHSMAPNARSAKGRGLRICARFEASKKCHPQPSPRSWRQNACHRSRLGLRGRCSGYPGMMFHKCVQYYNFNCGVVLHWFRCNKGPRSGCRIHMPRGAYKMEGVIAKDDA
jgi:hypothetical protein